MQKINFFKFKNEFFFIKKHLGSKEYFTIIYNTKKKKNFPNFKILKFMQKFHRLVCLFLALFENGSPNSEVSY